MIDLGLDGARAIVFGAGYIPERAGLGPTTALRLAEAGARVACVDRDLGRAHETVDKVLAAGGSAFPLVGDVTDEAQVSSVIDEAVSELGGLDTCVNIIGHTNWSRTTETTAAEWNQALLINLTQVFFVFRSAIPHLIKQGTGGSLVALSSVDGMHAARFHGAYGAAKAGTIMLAQTMADEFGQYGIRVNTVAPGNVGGGNLEAPDVAWGDDEHNPLAPPRAKDIADAVLFLASNLSERITGQNLVVDGGAMTMNRWGLTDNALGVDDSLAKLVNTD